MPKGISEAQKKALRDFYFTERPHPSQSACISWFEEKFGRKITQSTVSVTLSSKYAYLDTGPPTSNTKSRTTPGWRKLERALFEWQQRAERKGKLVTGDILIQNGQEIWAHLPESKDPKVKAPF